MYLSLFYAVINLYRIITVNMSGHSVIDVYPYCIRGGSIYFLILHRSEKHIYADQWRMVAGKVSNKEKAWEAGLRELKEETGCEPVTYWTVPSLNHFYEYKSDKILLIPAFAAEIADSSEILLNEEHDKYDWVNAGSIRNKIFWPEQRNMYQLINDIVRSNNILPNWIII